MAKYVLGIDFGEDTCFIAVAKREGRIQSILKDFKCIVAFGENERIFGIEAKNQENNNKKNTISGIRQLIGRHYTDPDLQEARSFQTLNQSDGRVGIKVKFLKQERIFTPTQITGMLFAKIKQLVEDKLETEVTDAVIGVPCFFDEKRREAVRNAARIAGLKVLELMNETTASALNSLKTDTNARNVVFVNAGSNVLQVSVIKLVSGKLQALATSVHPKFVSNVNGLPIMDSNQVLKTMQECLKNSGIKIEEISSIMAVGSSSQHPSVKAAITDVFGKQPITENQSEAIAHGCAQKAASLIFKNGVFDIEEVAPTFPYLYNTVNNQHPMELTIGSLSELMKVEEQLVCEENDQKIRSEAKKHLEEYLEEFAKQLKDTKISENYSGSLTNALTVTMNLLNEEEENIQTEDFANILIEFKRHEELIEIGLGQDLNREQKHEGNIENEEKHLNQAEQGEPASSPGPRGKGEPAKSYDAKDKMEQAQSGSVRERAKMFNNQEGTNTSPTRNAQNKTWTTKTLRDWIGI